MEKGRKSEKHVIPTKMLAEIIGTSQNNIQKIKRGARGKRSVVVDKIKFCEKYYAENIAPLKQAYDKEFDNRMNYAKEILTPPRD